MYVICWARFGPQPFFALGTPERGLSSPRLYYLTAAGRLSPELADAQQYPSLVAANAARNEQPSPARLHVTRAPGQRKEMAS